MGIFDKQFRLLLSDGFESLDLGGIRSADGTIQQKLYTENKTTGISNNLAFVISPSNEVTAFTNFIRANKTGVLKISLGLGAYITYDDARDFYIPDDPDNPYRIPVTLYSHVNTGNGKVIITSSLRGVIFSAQASVSMDDGTVEFDFVDSDGNGTEVTIEMTRSEELTISYNFSSSACFTCDDEDYIRLYQNNKQFFGSATAGKFVQVEGIMHYSFSYNVPSVVSDEVESLANLRLGLERGDFQSVVLAPTGLSSAIHKTRDRLTQRFVNGMDLGTPAVFSLEKARELGTQEHYELIAQLAIDDTSLAVNEEKIGFNTKELSLIQRIRDNKDVVYSVRLDKTLRDDMRVDYNYCNAFVSAENRFLTEDLTGGFALMPITLAGTAYGGGINVGFSSYKKDLGVLGYKAYSGSAADSEATGISKTTGAPIEITLRADNGWYVDVEYYHYEKRASTLMLRVICRYSDDGYDYINIPEVKSYKSHGTGDGLTERYYFEATKLVKTFSHNTPTCYYFGYVSAENHTLSSYDASAVFYPQDDNQQVLFYAALTKQGLNKGVPCVNLFTALGSCLDQIAGATCVIDIALNNLRKDLRFDCVLANPLNFKEGAVTYEIKTTIYDVLKAIDSIYCIGIEESEQSCLRVADRDKIRRRFNSTSVEDYADLQVEQDKDHLFKSIKAGCNKGISSDVDGKLEVHGELEYQLSDIGDSGSEYDISLAYYANPSGIEQYLKESQTSDNENTHKSNVKDDAIFLYAVSPNNLLPYSDFRLCRVAADKMANMPINIYNLPISPMRCLLRHANYLAGTIQAFSNKKEFTLADTQNVSLVQGSSLMPFESTWVTENLVILPIATAKAFLTTKKVSFKSDVYFSDKLKYENRNSPILIRSGLLPKAMPQGQLYQAPVFTEGNAELVISPMGIDYAFCENDTSEVTGTLATDETEVNGSHYLANYCTNNIF